MPRVTQEHLNARRRQILEAALRCFARNGIHPTSMQDIFHEAGLSAGAVYRYYPTKELLVVGVVETVLGMSQTAVGGHGSGDGTDTAAQGGPDAVLDRLLGVFDDPGPGDQHDRYSLVLQIWAEAMRSPKVGATLRASTDRLRALVAAQVAESQERGLLRDDLDPSVVARTLTALFEGYALQRALDPDIDTEAYRAAVRELVQHGLTRT